jgi:hypothetical protein
MKLLNTLLLAAALIATLPAQDRKKIYVDRMEGLEPVVEQALQDAGLLFDFVEEEKEPELKATLKKTHSAYGEILYKHKLGRNETHRLELRDVETGKVIAWHMFRLTGNSEEGRKKEAAVFATKVRTALDKERLR